MDWVKRRRFGAKEFLWNSENTSVFKNWDLSEPNNFGGKELFAEMFLGTDGLWNDNKDLKSQFI
jgi:hypothetical protein